MKLESRNWEVDEAWRKGMVGILPLTGKSSIYIQEDHLKKLNHGCKKFISRKVLYESNAEEYKAIVEKPGLKLNAFINSTKA